MKQRRSLWFWKSDWSGQNHYGMWFFPWYAVLKPSEHEIFSERYGHKKCFRLLGWTLTVGKRPALK
jgi:hypothetical protein